MGIRQGWHRLIGHVQAAAGSLKEEAARSVEAEVDDPAQDHIADSHRGVFGHGMSRIRDREGEPACVA